MKLINTNAYDLSFYRYLVASTSCLLLAGMISRVAEVRQESHLFEKNDNLASNNSKRKKSLPAYITHSSCNS